MTTSSHFVLAALLRAASNCADFEFSQRMGVDGRDDLARIRQHLNEADASLSELEAAHGDVPQVGGPVMASEDHHIAHLQGVIDHLKTLRAAALRGYEQAVEELGREGDDRGDGWSEPFRFLSERLRRHKDDASSNDVPPSATTTTPDVLLRAVERCKAGAPE